MVKKILVILIAALCCVLIGLSVLFYYLNYSTNKKNSILSYIPAETGVVLRIKRSSETANAFLKNPIVENCFGLDDLKNVWLSIDSITSRNYKTSEVLLKNTSYICFDSSGHFLILIDLDKKTNEHFIDQFLVNSTSLRKIEKYKEGYKAFFPQADKPLFYYVKHNVFGVSSDQNFILSSLQHGQTEKTESLISDWDVKAQSDLVMWSKNGSEQVLFRKFGVASLLGNWSAALVTSNSMEITFDKNKVEINSTMMIDSSDSALSVFYSQPNGSSVYFYQADTGVWENQFYSLQIKDSLNKFQPVSFVYSSFVDSSGAFVSMLVSTSPVTLSLFKLISADTSVQIIPMADENIKQIAVFDKATCKRILPIVPFPGDSAKLFATIYEGTLFIGNTTEIILNIASTYPGENFIKKKLESSVIIHYSGNKLYSNPYFTQYSYQMVNKKTISFTSQIENVPPRK